MWPRPRRRWLLHLAGDAGSVEGLFRGFWCDHYVIQMAEYLEGADRTVSLEGRDVKIHRDRVLFIQEL